MLAGDFPVDWREAIVGIAHDGYEPISFAFHPDRIAASIPLYRTLVIRPGESLETRVFLDTYVCGFEFVRCRRVTVESAPGESTDVEVTHVDREGILVALVVGDPLIVRTDQRKVTVTGTQGVSIWVDFTLSAGLTLTARPH